MISARFCSDFRFCLRFPPSHDPHRRPAAPRARGGQFGPAHHAPARRRRCGSTGRSSSSTCRSGRPPTRRNCARSIAKDEHIKTALRERRRRFRADVPRGRAFPHQLFLQKGSIGIVARLIPKRILDTGGDRPAAGDARVDPPAARADPRHRADRLGQIDVAGQHDQRHQRDKRACTSSRSKTPSSISTSTSRASSTSARSAWTCRPSARRSSACCGRTRT